ncbi:MAG: hypothetical protein ACI4XP_03995 [Acutalibacteraceae bacterium]
MSDNNKNGLGCFGKGCLIYFVVAVGFQLIGGLIALLAKIDKSVWIGLGVGVGAISALVITILIIAKTRKNRRIQLERMRQFEHEQELKNAENLKQEIVGIYREINRNSSDIYTYKICTEYNGNDIQKEAWQSLSESVDTNADLLAIVKEINC